MTISDEQIKLLNIGYDLDSGGYSFERDDRFPDCAVWDSPDYDYLPVERPPEAWDTLFLFCPNGRGPSVDFADDQVLPADNEGCYVILEHGMLYATDHDCTCFGRPSVEHLTKLIDDGRISQERLKQLPPPLLVALDEALEVRETESKTKPRFTVYRKGDDWEFTGSSSDIPHPDCDRCEGEGYVESPGGDYAILVYREFFTPDDEGCYADGGYGWDHVRRRLSGILESYVPRHALVAELHEDASDDGSEENDAVAWLNDNVCVDGCYFELEDGLFLRVDEDEDD